MKLNQIIQSFEVDSGIITLELNKIYPIKEINGVKNRILKAFIDDKESVINSDGVIYMNKVTVECFEKGSLHFLLGSGYVAQKDDMWTNRFEKFVGWSGGDGIFSFNLTDGNDQFDRLEECTTLFVFGDTFVGRVDKQTKRRYEPLLMPNNSMGYLDKGKTEVEFKINRNHKDSVIAFFGIDKKYDIKGTIPQNLAIYDQKHSNVGWMSGYHPQSLSVSFDLSINQQVTHLHIYNYYSNEDKSLSSRGVKNFKMFGSKDHQTWEDLGEYTLRQAVNADDFDKIIVGKEFRYFKFEINPTLGVGNYNDEYNEGIFALSRVEFYNDTQKFRDVEVQANSVLLEEPSRAWIWLQDGVVIENHLYFFPLVIVQDLTQPEGLQFAVKGVSMIKVPIVNNRLDYHNATQKLTPLLVQKGDSEFLFGGAIMANTKQANAVDADGYIYIYGYKTTLGLRQMIVSRVKAELIEHFDKWEYFNGNVWTSDITSSAPLLDHISCEFSVSPILKGKNKGKYLAVFTYDVNTPYVAFSIGDTKVGPFSVPQTIYHTPEQEIYKSTTYTYNAKAHPHLSDSTDVLVSYNTNTYSFEHNMADGGVYRPRFIRLIEVKE